MLSIIGRIIPSELGSLILKHLDKPSLAACTLLSNKDGWHAFARTQLFHTLTINISLKDYEHNFLAFSRYVTSAPKHSIEYTRKLTLRGEHYAECNVHNLLRVLERLESLSDLQLEKFWLRSSDTASGSSGFTLPRQLKSIAMSGVEPELDMRYAEGLRFDNVVASTECSLVQLLGYVPHIKTLRLQDIASTWHSDFEDRDPMGEIRFAVARMEGQKLPSNLRLEHLSVLVAREKVGPFLLHMFQNSTIGDQLQRLSVAHSSENPSHTKEFILRVGRDVKHLELSYLGKDAHIVSIFFGLLCYAFAHEVHLLHSTILLDTSHSHPSVSTSTTLSFPDRSVTWPPGLPRLSSHPSQFSIPAPHSRSLFST